MNEKTWRYSVRAKARKIDPRLIHICSRDSPSFIPFIHERHHLLVAANHQLAQILHVGTQRGVFSHTQITCVFGIEEVADFFVVDLRECVREKGWFGTENALRYMTLQQ